MNAEQHRTFKALLTGPFCYADCIAACRLLADAFDFLGFNYLGSSIMGHSIPLLTLGRGEKEFVYVGTHHGAERITGGLLLYFIAEFCAAAKGRRGICGVSPEYLMQTRKLCLLPMLNVDGADIAARGAPKDHLLTPRLLAMCKDGDFTHWQANARGVDLNHNYNAGFEVYRSAFPKYDETGGAPSRYAGLFPESEPETAAMAGFLRYRTPAALLTLHTQGREIYATSGGKCPRQSPAAAKKLAELTGYAIKTPVGEAAFGGLTDYCITALDLPAFTLECGKGQNPLPHGDLLSIYAEIRTALFVFPTLF
ncbi:MAG: hypothetical protein IJU41_08250 [Clostridia bacterium]|nr:hypothetical protein [Clostridia bacterium]